MRTIGVKGLFLPGIPDDPKANESQHSRKAYQEDQEGGVVLEQQVFVHAVKIRREGSERKYQGAFGLTFSSSTGFRGL